MDRQMTCHGNTMLYQGHVLSDELTATMETGVLQLQVRNRQTTFPAGGREGC